MAKCASDRWVVSALERAQRLLHIRRRQAICQYGRRRAEEVRHVWQATRDAGQCRVDGGSPRGPHGVRDMSEGPTTRLGQAPQEVRPWRRVKGTVEAPRGDWSSRLLCARKDWAGPHADPCMPHTDVGAACGRPFGNIERDGSGRVEAANVSPADVFQPIG